MKNKVLIIVAAMALCLSGCGSNWMGFMASDESDEACKYQVSSDLDSANFEAVLSSSCSDDMQKGAAYFGKAGYDINDVINNFVEASSAQQTGDPLQVYMTTLVGKVTSDNLINLNKAKSSYGVASKSADFSENSQKDAVFYSALVSAVKSLSLLKAIMDADGDGQLLSNCDINLTNSPDDADAVSCSLEASTAIANLTGNCTSGTATTYATYTKSGATAMELVSSSGAAIPGTYKGVSINLTGTATASCPSTYKKLQADTGSGYYYISVTTSEKCYEKGFTGNSSKEWPCPLLNESNQPIGLAEGLQTSLNDASGALALSMGASSNDVTTAITAINSGACGTDAVCSESEVASYIQSLSK